MEHLQIAYDLCVILIGFAALSMAWFWASKTGRADLRDFCIVYALFTLVLIIAVLKKYLFINVASYSAQSWYFISGVYQFFSFAVIVACLQFFLGFYQVRFHRGIILAALGLMLVCLGIILSPFGAHLDVSNNTIRFGLGYQLTSLWYLASFTLVLVLGYGLLRRQWNTNQQTFLLGLLIFATVGYVETVLNVLATWQTPSVTLTTESDFLYSSIPYALYGIFLIYYFWHFSVPAPLGIAEISPAFLSQYGITEREREIILKVVAGKSNADIAKELVISLATVKTHLHNIYQKIGINSRYDLLARVRSHQ